MTRDYTGLIDPKITALKQELRPGERIAWQSIQYPRLTGAPMAIFLFAIPWTAFALFWIGTAWFMTRSVDGATDPLAMVFPLFGLPFVFVGMGMMATPFLRYISAKRTIFAVTNQRIIRLYKRKGVLCQSVPAKRIGKVKLFDGKDGHDTLQITLKGKAADFEPKGAKFVIRDIKNAEAAKKFIKRLAEQSSD